VIRSTDAGIEIEVRVIPRAGRSEVAGERDGRLLVRVSAPPVEGAANDALIDLFARLFHRPRRSVRIVAGEKSRAKRIAVDGVTEAEATKKLEVRS
jgi:uncharacterized protein (TIGR00251 family)